MYTVTNYILCDKEVINPRDDLCGYFYFLSLSILGKQTQSNIKCQLYPSTQYDLAVIFLTLFPNDGLITSINWICKLLSDNSLRISTLYHKEYRNVIKWEMETIRNMKLIFFSFSYITKRSKNKSDILRDVKPLKLGQSSVKPICSSIPSNSVMNTWLFES